MQQVIFNRSIDKTRFEFSDAFSLKKELKAKGWTFDGDTKVWHSQNFLDELLTTHLTSQKDLLLIEYARKLIAANGEAMGMQTKKAHKFISNNLSGTDANEHRTAIKEALFFFSSAPVCLRCFNPLSPLDAKEVQKVSKRFMSITILCGECVLDLNCCGTHCDTFTSLFQYVKNDGVCGYARKGLKTIGNGTQGRVDANGGWQWRK